MTNEETESVEAAPEAAPEGEATVEATPEAPGDEAPEAPVAVTAPDDAPKKNVGLIAGIAALAVLVIAGIVVGGLAIGGVFSSDKKDVSGDPATVVKSYFDSRTCTAAKAQVAPGEWAELNASSGSAGCQDSQVASFANFKVSVKSTKIEDGIANVDVSVTTPNSPTAQSATINLIPVKGEWKIDHIIAKATPAG